MTPDQEALYGRLMMAEAARAGHVRRFPQVAGKRSDRDGKGRPMNLLPGTLQAAIWDALERDGPLTLAQLRSRLTSHDRRVREALLNLSRRKAIRRIRPEGAPHQFEVVR